MHIETARNNDGFAENILEQNSAQEEFWSMPYTRVQKFYIT